MARWWKEPYDATNPDHADKMWGAGWPYAGIGYAVETTPSHTMYPAWIYFVSVCSFTFVFRSLAQLRACLAFYQQDLLPSSRIVLDPPDHWEVQTWYQRLPLRFREQPKRRKVITALTRALAEFSA